MAAEPYIYSKNYVNADDVFSVSSGADSFSNAYDRDKDSQWKSSGAASDLTSINIYITFYEGTATVSRTFDTILLVNHNLNIYTMSYWTGSTWTPFIAQAADTSQAKPYNVSAYGNTPVALASFSPITTTAIYLGIFTTQTPNQEKAIGEIVCCNTQLAFGQDLYSYKMAFRQKTKDLLLGDGSLHRAVIPWTPNRIEKYECSWQMILVPDATLRSLMMIKQSGKPFLWYPESISRPDEVWYCHWADPRQYDYASFVKGAGSTVAAKFVEV